MLPLLLSQEKEGDEEEELVKVGKEGGRFSVQKAGGLRIDLSAFCMWVPHSIF